MICPNCESRNIVKYGKTRTGKQRYFCKNCKKETQNPIKLENKIMFMKNKIKVGVVLGCIHYPLQDDLSLNSICNFLNYLKPDELHLNGDIWDFALISKFTQNKYNLPHLQKDLDEGKKMIETIIKSCDNKDLTIYFNEGNHETRIVNFILNECPELFSLRALQPENLFGLKDLGIKYMPRQNPYHFNNLLIHHGEYVRKYSGWSVKAEIEEYGLSIIMNHCHRLGATYKSTKIEELVGIEAGHLSVPEKHSYLYGTSNWQQGFAIYYLYNNKRYSITTIPIINHKFIYDKKIFIPEGIVE